MTIQRLIAPAEWKAADDDPNGALEGYLSTFNNVDLQGDVIEPGAFAKTVNRVNKDGIPLLADHNASVRNVLGTIVQAAEDPTGLRIRAKFAADSDSQAIRQKLLDGHLKAMSIGYEPIEFSFREQGGQQVRVLKEVKLWEGSVVVFPANPRALVDAVKSAVTDTVNALVAGAVANGGNETEIKAALAGVTGQAGADRTDAKTVISSDLPLYDDRTRSYADAEVTSRVRKWASTDGSGDIDKIDWTKFRQAFLWHDAAKPEEIGSYRLNIADVVDGKLVAIWRGITVIAGVMQGSRGGTTIPDADRAGVKTQIEKYYAKARTTFDDDSIQVPWKSAGHGEATSEPERIKRLLYGADALLSGGRPDDIADPIKLAGAEARMDALDTWLKQRGREAELHEELDRLRS